MSNGARDAKFEGAWLLHAWHLKVGSTFATVEELRIFSIFIIYIANLFIWNE